MNMAAWRKIRPSAGSSFIFDLRYTSYIFSNKYVGGRYKVEDRNLGKETVYKIESLVRGIEVFRE
jgi:hypothetical protein